MKTANRLFYKQSSCMLQWQWKYFSFISLRVKVVVVDMIQPDFTISATETFSALDTSWYLLQPLNAAECGPLLFTQIAFVGSSFIGQASRLWPLPQWTHLTWCLQLTAMCPYPWHQLHWMGCGMWGLTLNLRNPMLTKFRKGIWVVVGRFFFWSFSLYCLPWWHIFLAEYSSQHYSRLSCWTIVIRCQCRWSHSSNSW